MPTLIVEDGTCPDGANAYADLASADAYCINRNLWADSAGDAVVISKKETAIIRATDWLDSKVAWKGRKTDWRRTMAWPRKDVVVDDVAVSDDEVPPAVAAACCELAGFFISEDYLTPLERGGEIAAETIGSLSFTYKDDAPVGTSFPKVAGLLKGLGRVENGSAGGPFELGRG